MNRRMKRTRFAWLVIRALSELIRYDVIHSTLRVDLRPQPTGPIDRTRSPSTEWETAVCDAVVLACCLYWKPVLCLQRSVCAWRLLRARGVHARVVIGYRPVPFFSHAWVEVDGHVVNDSPVYQRRLTVLHTI